MNTTLNIQDYLSEDEIKEILIGEYRTWFRTMSEQDKLRILSNFSYDFIFKNINDNLDGKLLELTKQKTLETLEEANFNYFVFRPADAWSKPESVPMTMINSIVKSKHTVIEAKIDKAIEGLSNKDLRQWVLNFSVVKK